MNNFLQKFREYYETLFPMITDENIVRRTMIFYTLLYLSLFFTGYSIGALSVSNLALTIVLYLFFGLTASNFILSKRIPYPAYFFNLFHGFNLFIALYMLYVGFIFLLESFIFAFDINIYEFKYANIFIITLLSIFLILSLIIFFHYIKNGLKEIFHFIQQKTKKM